MSTALVHKASVGELKPTLKDWKIERLGNLIKIKGGFAFSSEYFGNNGSILLTPGNFKIEGGLYFSKKNTKRYSGLISKNHFLQSGALVIVMTDLTPNCQLLGKPAFIDHDEALLHNQRIGLVILTSTSVTLDFLYLHFLSEHHEKWMKNSSTGSTVRHTSSNKIYDGIIAIPTSLSEQQKITSALFDLIDLIKILDQLIAKKRNIQQAAMQQLLKGQRRLPGFSGEWKNRSLGDIANIKTGSKNNQDKVEDGEYPFYVRSATVERINSYSHDCEAILVPGEGNIGSIFHYIDGRFDVHQRVYAITQFASDVSGKYVHLFLSVHFGAHAMQNSVKATVDSLRLPTFQVFEVLLPPTKEEQIAIANILHGIESELSALEARRDKALQLKQGMMQELLTGRIRLV